MRLIKPLEVTESDFVERTSNAYYRGPEKLLEVAGPDVARFFYNNDGEFAGFLLEPDPVQSVIKHSEVYSSDAFWTKDGLTLGADVLGPDGVADSAVEISGTGTLEYHEKTVENTTFTFASSSQSASAKIEVLPQVAGVAPTIQNVGSVLTTPSDASSITLTWPAHAVDDIAFVFAIDDANNAAYPSLSGPGAAAYNQFLTTGPSSGTAGVRTRIVGWWARATSASMAQALIATPGTSGATFRVALMITMRGVKNTGDPFGTITNSVNSSASTSHTIPGLVASGVLSRLLDIAAYGNDAASNAATAFANATAGMTDYTVHVAGSGTAVGNGGGIVAASAQFESQGYITGLAESMMRSSTFLRYVSGNPIVKLYNTRGSDEAEFDLSTGELISGEGEPPEQYANGFWRIAATKDTGFIASEYGFGLEIDGVFHAFGANLTPTLRASQYVLNDTPMTGDNVIESTAVNLIYSNIPEPDPDFAPEADAEMWAAGSYDEDDVVIYGPNNHRYIALSANSDVPPEGAAKDVPTWADAGTSNRWRMFDFTRGVDFKSEREDLIEVLIQVPGVARSFALFGLEATSVTVEAYLGEDLVYNETFNLINVSAIANWYDYFSVTPTNTLSLVKFDLPPVPGLLVKISIEQEGMVRVGKLIIGTSVDMGCAAWGFTSQLINTSRQERDAFGELVLVPRRIYRTRDFTLKYPTDLAEHIENTVISVVNTPTVFIGSENLPTSLVFGIVKEFTPVINGPKQSTASLRLEEI